MDQDRAKLARATVKSWMKNKSNGDTRDLSTYEGFSQPYNFIFIATAHKYFPFNFKHAGATQGSSDPHSNVVRHPLIINGVLDDDQVYDSECPPQPCCASGTVPDCCVHYVEVE